MKILLVEDDLELAGRIQRMLSEAGFSVQTVSDGRDAVYVGENFPLSAIVLDLGLPLLDGVSVLGHLRAQGMTTPILVLTARSRWSDKLSAFQAGADDYLTKPFEMEELVLRLRALIRRSKGHASPVLECGPLRLYSNDQRVTVDGETVSLTAHETRLLVYFMHHRDRVISRTEIFDHVYDPDSDRDSNVIDVLIARIRKKLSAPLIHTVRGVGYRLSADSNE